MNEIFVAIYERLSAQVSRPVFDHVPQDYDDYPYIEMEMISDAGNDTDTENGFNSTIQIVTYSRYRGGKELSDLQTEIYNALQLYKIGDTANFGVSGGLQQTIKTGFKQPDGITRKGVQRFQLFYEQLPS